MKKQKKSKNDPKQFLIKKEDQYFLVSEQLMVNMTPEEIYRTALIAHIDQKKYLLQEAYNQVLKIESKETIKIPEELEESLKKCEEIYPLIREDFHLLNSKTFKC